MLAKKFGTLIEMLMYRAEKSSVTTAFTFSGEAYSYSQLWHSVIQIGSFLSDIGISPGECITVAMPNGEEFLRVFFGIQLAGGVAVPIFPGSGADRAFAISKICGAQNLFVPASIPISQLDALIEQGDQLGVNVVTPVECNYSAGSADFPTIRAEDIAFIQYTSGSTGNPKGVQLSHDNLLTNIAQMIEGMQITKEDVFVSWLPVYHDMGLILMALAPFYLGTRVHLLPTTLNDVHPWLDSLQSREATFTAAPDFAYRLCLRHSNPAEYDLSSLRVALNAAEPVRAQTIKDFETAFGLHNVMTAGYGLAEATVGVSMSSPASAIKVDDRGFVSVGHPFPGVELKIVPYENDGETQEIGEIAIRSKANTRGYFKNPGETKELFWKDGYLLSGDLGYIDGEGNLYVVGRKKNIIKRSGETISPREIEEIVDNHPSIRYSAAVGVDKGKIQGEQIYIFAEVRDGENSPINKLFDTIVTIVDAVYKHMGYHPGRVYLLKPHSIPLTHNGKLQHARLKAYYLEGILRKNGAILFPDY